MASLVDALEPAPGRDDFVLDAARSSTYVHRILNVAERLGVVGR